MAGENLDICGCCKEPADHGAVHNRPGLTKLDYRVGTHGDFLHRMLTRLPHESIEDAPDILRYPLAPLTTRSSDDAAIALLDAWAAIGDVLTFYQERIANEGYLRTSTERRSILELGRLIGYELNPGVAASAYLAFQTDTADGAPLSVVVPQGAQVHSVPGQDEHPQTFETGTTITARREWNQLKPRLMRPQQLAINGESLYLLGVGSGTIDATSTFPLDPGLHLPTSGTVAASEVDTIYVAGTSTNLHPGDVILHAGLHGNKTAALPRTVRAVHEEPALERTRVDFDMPVKAPAFKVFSEAPKALATFSAASFDSGNVDDLIVGHSWSEGQLSTWLNVQGWSSTNTVQYIYGAYNKPSPPPPAAGDPGTFAMRTKLGFFGHNAPAFGSLTLQASGPFHNWDADKGMSIWSNSLKGAPPNNNVLPYGSAAEDADCYLERSVSGIVGDSWAVLELPSKRFTAFQVARSAEASLVGYSLSSKTTGLGLRTAAGVELDNVSNNKSDEFNVRTTTAHVVSDRLTLAQLPIDEPLGDDTPEKTELTLDRMVLNLSKGQPIIVSGEREDLRGVKATEVVIIDDVIHSGGFSTLYFVQPGLTNKYLRSTVTLCANVTDATHGASVVEVLGSGDGGTANAGFVLKKPPVTYTASSDVSGTENSLEIRVDGVEWVEAPRLLGLQPTDEAYIVRRADDGTTAVIFGDGVQGARLPTGVENIVARYRSGIGTAGMVRPNTLTMLMTRPLGIHDVTNPLAASGAADPEARDEARHNAPLTVLTIDRVVSLLDAEDFARAFAGIGKCAAKAVSRRGIQWVHLTIAAAAATADSGPVSGVMADHRLLDTAPLRTNLSLAFASASEPSMRIKLDTYQPAFFNVSARVLIDPRYLWAGVEARAKGALMAAFAFDRRGFGQSVTMTEVVTIIQRTPGVVFVDLEALHLFDQLPTLASDGVLISHEVVWSDDAAEPSALAELLLVNPLGITLTPVNPESIQ